MDPEGTYVERLLVDKSKQFIHPKYEDEKLENDIGMSFDLAATIMNYEIMTFPSSRFPRISNIKKLPIKRFNRITRPTEPTSIRSAH